MTKKPPATRVQCARSPTGWHQLDRFASVGSRDDRHYPPGTEVYLQCRHCKAGGRVLVEDIQVRWDDAERLPE